MIKYSSIYGLLHAHHAYFFAHCSTLPVHFCHISIHMYISYLLHNECISTIFRLLSERPLSPWIDSFWSDNKNTWKNCKNGFDIYAMVLLLIVIKKNYRIYLPLPSMLLFITSLGAYILFSHKQQDLTVAFWSSNDFTMLWAEMQYKCLEFRWLLHM